MLNALAFPEGISDATRSHSLWSVCDLFFVDLMEKTLVMILITLVSTRGRFCLYAMHRTALEVYWPTLGSSINWSLSAGIFPWCRPTRTFASLDSAIARMFSSPKDLTVFLISPDLAALNASTVGKFRMKFGNTCSTCSRVVFRNNSSAIRTR